MKKGITFYIDDDVDMIAFCGTLCAQTKNTDEPIRGVTMLNLSVDEIKECSEWYIPVKGKAEPYKSEMWIPVSEKTPPNEEKSYWICTEGGYQCQCRWTNTNHVFTYLTSDWHWHIMDIPQYDKVVAWMPLPERYKEVRNEE